jgi:hypothetical protein
VPYSGQIAALFPHGQRFEFEGEELILVPHGADETQLLRNLGYTQVPAPIEEHYDFPSADGKRPFSKQVLTAACMTMHRRSFVLNGMGTGKTKACIWSFDYLKKVGRAKRMLVVCPLSTVRFTWEREIFNTIPDLKVEVLSGSADRRRRHLANDADIYITNHDGIKTLYTELTGPTSTSSASTGGCLPQRGRPLQGRTEACRVPHLRLGRRLARRHPSPTDAYRLAKLIVPDTAPRSFHLVPQRHHAQRQPVQVGAEAWCSGDGVEGADAGGPLHARRDRGAAASHRSRDQIEMGSGRRTYKMLKEHRGSAAQEGTITAVNGGVLFSSCCRPPSAGSMATTD